MAAKIFEGCPRCGAKLTLPVPANGNAVARLTCTGCRKEFLIVKGEAILVVARYGRVEKS